jgi:mRNA export factor
MAGLFSSGGGNTSASTANTLGDLKNDITLNSPPEDSISDLSFSPQSAHLAVASWDKKVRIYEINNTGGVGRAAFDHEAPVLSCHWSPVSTYGGFATM